MKLRLFFLILFLSLIGFTTAFGQVKQDTLKKEKTTLLYDAKRHGLKISLQSIFLTKGEYITLAYEYKKSNRHHYQFTLGLKGSNPNKSTYLDGSVGDTVTVAEIPHGFFFKFSSRKYALKSGVGQFKIKPKNFQGYYFEPEIVFGFYNRNTPHYNFPSNIVTLNSKKIWYLGLTTNVGMQRNFNRVLIDFHVGCGIGYANLDRDFSYSYDFNHRGLYKKNGRMSLAFQIDAKIGGVF